MNIRNNNQHSINDIELTRNRSYLGEHYLINVSSSLAWALLEHVLPILSGISFGTLIMPQELCEQEFWMESNQPYRDDFDQLIAHLVALDLLPLTQAGTDLDGNMFYLVN